MARVIEYRTPAEIEQMRPAGRFVAEVLTALKSTPTSGSTCWSWTSWRTG